MKYYDLIPLLCGVSLLLIPACSDAQVESTNNNSTANQITVLNNTLSTDSLNLEEQFFSQGNNLFDAGKYNDSISYYDQALAISPNDTDALYQKARALNNLGQYNDAIRYYDMVITIDPGYTDALRSKGIALGNLNQTADAITYYDKALAANPNDTDSLLRKGETLETLGMYEQSIPLFDRILQIDSSNTDALYQKGLALDKLGKKDDAVIYYDKVLAIDPTNTAVLNSKNLAQGKPALKAGENLIDQRVLISVGIIVLVLAIIIFFDRTRTGKRVGTDVKDIVHTVHDERIENRYQTILKKDDDYEWKGI